MKRREPMMRSAGQLLRHDGYEYHNLNIRTEPGWTLIQRVNRGVKIMFCPKCGNQNSEGASFCRKCGTDLEYAFLAAARHNSSEKKVDGKTLVKAESRDPDELTAGGIANVIIGDGFF